MKSSSSKIHKIRCSFFKNFKIHTKNPIILDRRGIGMLQCRPTSSPSSSAERSSCRRIASVAVADSRGPSSGSASSCSPGRRPSTPGNRRPRSTARESAIPGSGAPTRSCRRRRTTAEEVFLLRGRKTMKEGRARPRSPRSSPPPTGN